MGPLIFVARKHQIQRKKSQLNMRLMQIQNQREKIAEQIGQAQQAKTARQNLFNSTSRMAQNSIMAMMNMMNAGNNYASNLALQNSVFGAQQNLMNMNNAFGTNGTSSYILCGPSAEAYGSLIDTSKPVDSKGNIIAEGASTPVAGYMTNRNISQAEFSNFANQAYQQTIREAYAANQANNLSQMGTNLALSNMMNSNNLFNNLINNISNLNDEAELESLNAIDSQLEQEQTTVETQLKMLEAELSSVDKQLDNEIKQSAPKFGLSG